jgi:hypothetical protein
VFLGLAVLPALTLSAFAGADGNGTFGQVKIA